MKVVSQSIDDILASLRPLEVDWQDDTAVRVIAAIRSLPEKAAYTPNDIRALLQVNFEDAISIIRLFLGLSKDQFTTLLREARLGRNDVGIGVKAFLADPDLFVSDLVNLGILEAMAREVNRVPHWTDSLVERLRSGRGSAIAGQKRGRSVEDFAETVVKRVFGNNFQARCSFVGPRGRVAKCDFAIPSNDLARILIEAKGYAATGSKMSDILGDIRAIVEVKRSDTALLFFTDGLTWKERQSDLRKIVEMQNNGDIARIYTYGMAEQFEKDLQQLKAEFGLS